MLARRIMKNHCISLAPVHSRRGAHPSEASHLDVIACLDAHLPSSGHAGEPCQLLPAPFSKRTSLEDLQPAFRCRPMDWNDPLIGRDERSSNERVRREGIASGPLRKGDVVPRVDAQPRVPTTPQLSRDVCRHLTARFVDSRGQQDRLGAVAGDGDGNEREHHDVTPSRGRGPTPCPVARGGSWRGEESAVHHDSR